MARHNEIGKIGEEIAANWLKAKGFSIVELNYLKKWGEIDIVARQSGRQARGTDELIHFVEVKTVSYETRADLERAVTPASRTGGHETWRPEDNVHKNKQDRLKRAIQTWLIDNKYEGEWQIDIVTVRLVPREKFARVKCLENIIFE